MRYISNKEGLSQYLAGHEHTGGIIVSIAKKMIYMKPTKTAGTSILRNCLEKKIEGIIHGKDHPVEFDKWLKNITDEQLEDYFIFSVVRNPYDRLVSIASYFKIPFADFAADIEKYRQEQNVKIHSLPLHLYTHAHGRPFVDYICRFECLQFDFNIVCDHLGIERMPLPHVNKSKHRHYTTYYNQAARRTVENIYKKDLQYFGYSFEERKSPRYKFW